jgi:uncharacterized membrane protein
MLILFGFLVAVGLVLIGFWPSFFSLPAGLDTVHIVHGCFAVAWLAILISQAFLITESRFALHRLIGRVSVFVMAGLLISSFLMVHIMLADQGLYALPMDLRLTLGFIDIISLPAIAGFYIASIVCAFRRDIAAHQRAMTATLIIALIPALGRLFAIYVPWTPDLAAALPPTFVSLEVVTGLLCVYDVVRLKKLLWPYSLLLALLFALHGFMFYAPHIEAFVNLARLMGYPR